MTNSLNKDQTLSERNSKVILGSDGNDKLFSGRYNTTFNAGKGNDTMVGGWGNNTYIFRKGDGNDKVYSGAGDSKIVFEDITISDITSIQSRNGGIVINYGESDSFTLYNEFLKPQNQLTFSFADGQTLAYSELEKIVLEAQVGSEIGLYDYQGAKIVGTENRDNLIANMHDDAVFYGGKGNDTMVGGLYNNTYLFNKGDGNDKIHAYSGSNDIIFKGVAISDITSVARGYGNVVIKYGESDSITINGYYTSSNLTFSFDNGDSFSYSELKNLVEGGEIIGGGNITGTENDDVIYGTNGDDVILGLNGNDKIYGGMGNDTLIGGKGNDYLEGGLGNDIYEFSKGDGNDTINNYSGSLTKNNDKIVFKDVTQSEVTLSRDNHDLVLTYGGSDSVRVTNHFSGFNNSISSIEFSDGKTLAFEDIESSLSHSQFTGSNGNDGIYGSSMNDTILGLDGNDMIYAGSGNDILIGGKGNDYLEGGTGNDTYVFSKGDGVDRINNYSSLVEQEFDKISFTDVNQNEAIFVRDGNDLLLGYGETDSVRILNHFSSSNYEISAVEFADGSQLTASDINAIVSNVEVRENKTVTFSSYMSNKIESQSIGMIDSMASFGQAAGGEGTFTPSSGYNLDSIITASVG